MYARRVPKWVSCASRLTTEGGPCPVAAGQGETFHTLRTSVSTAGSVRPPPVLTTAAWAAMQSQTAVTAYLKSKQLQLFD